MREGQEPLLGQARVAAIRSVAGRWVKPADFPSSQEIRGEVFRQGELLRTPANKEAAAADPDAARFDVYQRLLEPLAHVMQSRDRHPEGDALYHSLQVFARMQAASPWDEELLLAALLHDVGKGIDPYDHIAAGLSALSGTISERTEWLIGCHEEAQRLHAGMLGVRALRRLSEHPDFESLLLLARCDREGCVPGAKVSELEEALEAIREVVRICEEGFDD